MPELENRVRAVFGDLQRRYPETPIGLAAVAGGLIYGYTETMALSDESTQYERMDRIFGNAKQTLESRPDPARREALLVELGKEALAENGEWVLMHHQRLVQLPHA